MAATDIVQDDGPLAVSRGSFTLDPGSLATGASFDEDADIPEARVGDIVHVNPRTGLDAGIVVQQAWVDADGSVKIRITNTTAGTVDVASATWDYVLIRGRSGLAH